MGKNGQFKAFSMPLTPSFVGSNPATPAKTTIYCVLFAMLNTMYGGYFYAFFMLWGVNRGVNL